MQPTAPSAAACTRVIDAYSTRIHAVSIILTAVQESLMDHGKGGAASLLTAHNLACLPLLHKVGPADASQVMLCALGNVLTHNESGPSAAQPRTALSERDLLKRAVMSSSRAAQAVQQAVPSCTKLWMHSETPQPYVHCSGCPALKGFLIKQLTRTLDSQQWHCIATSHCC